MRNRTKTVKTLALGLLGVGVLASGGCAQWLGISQGEIVIEGAKPMACTVQANQGTIQDFLANGILDINAPRSYTLPLSVRTNLPATFANQDVQQDRTRSPNYRNYGNSDANIFTANASYVHFTDGERDQPIVRLPDNSTPFSRRRTPISGSVANNGQGLGARAIFFVTAITEDESADLARGPLGAEVDRNTLRRVIAHITIEGSTSGGSPVVSNEFAFPIDICKGCLVPTECEAGETKVETPSANCVPFGQDEVQVACVP